MKGNRKINTHIPYDKKVLGWPDLTGADDAVDTRICSVMEEETRSIPALCIR